MAKLPKKSELHSDAWSRFERAVDVVAKSPPQHRIKKQKSPHRKKPESKPQSHRATI